MEVLQALWEIAGRPISADKVQLMVAGEVFRGGRTALWGSLAAAGAGGAMKLLPGLGHLAGALTQATAAGYFGHVVGRALVDYFDRDHDCSKSVCAGSSRRPERSWSRSKRSLRTGRGWLPWMPPA